MRRMYSEQELTNVIKKVFEEELESGALDELVSDAVDAYLVEHPVDITALEGQTIEPARINVANINGETNPSVKPIYCHPLELSCNDAENNIKFILTALIFNNSADPLNTWEKVKTAIASWGNVGRMMVSGGAKKDTSVVISSTIFYTSVSGKYLLIGNDTNGNFVDISSNFDLTNLTISVNDGVNKIN